MKSRLLRSAAVLLPALLFGACAGTRQERTDVVTARPVAACESMQGMAILASAIGSPTRGGRLASVTRVPASATELHPTNGTVFHALPEYCKVLGEIDPVDAAAPVIRFQLNIPTDWNARSCRSAAVA